VIKLVGLITIYLSVSDKASWSESSMWGNGGVRGVGIGAAVVGWLGIFGKKEDGSGRISLDLEPVPPLFFLGR
jgi:hypothetical protein